mmetsp:Transcript_32169/g.84331  ORF Transcript_32169/g.84331 Transcript_32169/m.84331 type:complete len:83 (+) Transcript_32169:907-1155(+)
MLFYRIAGTAVQGMASCARADDVSISTVCRRPPGTAARQSCGHICSHFVGSVQSSFHWRRGQSMVTILVMATRKLLPADMMV